MNPVVHFEMPYEDAKRMADFYTKAFGWKPQFMGEDMGNYVVVTTTEGDEKGRPKKPGAINGGFYQKTEDKLSHCSSVVVAVDDIEEAMQKIKQAGGKLLNEPSNIPGVGIYLSVMDTEGNRFGVLQPSGQM